MYLIYLCWWDSELLCRIRFGPLPSWNQKYKTESAIHIPTPNTKIGSRISVCTPPAVTLPRSYPNSNLGKIRRFICVWWKRSTKPERCILLLINCWLLKIKLLSTVIRNISSVFLSEIRNLFFPKFSMLFN